MAWGYVSTGEVPFSPMHVISDSPTTFSNLLENFPLSQGLE